MQTLYTKFVESAQRHSQRPAVFWKENGSWHKRSYAELLKRVDNLAFGLAQYGVKQGAHVALAAENRPEWLETDLAVNKIGAVLVSIHASSNHEYFEHVLSDSNSTCLFVSPVIAQKYQEVISGCKQLKNIILIGDKKPDGYESVVLFEELLKTDGAVDAADNELSSIIYTSGTTGKPKGVMLTNKNLLTNIDSIFSNYIIKPEDRFLSFLPLSHILERVLGQFAALYSGASIHYAESVKKLNDNLLEVRPTILICVPRIFERIEEKIFAAVKAKGGLSRKIFHMAMKQDRNKYLNRLAKLMISRKIKGLFGGRLRFAVSGGASLNERIMRFFMNLGVVITEGYGMTETSPIIAANRLADIRVGTVGELMPWVDAKLSAEKELLVKGDCLFSGYYGKEELRAEYFTEDDYFKTGDLAFFDKDKFLTIVGRKKEMLATTDGKKVNPEKLEAQLELNTFILQSLVVGHKRKYLSALIVPNMEVLTERFGEKIDNLKELIWGEIVKANEKAMPHEVIRKFCLLDQPFSMEADELTPTLKVRRHIIERKHYDLIERMYQE